MEILKFNQKFFEFQKIENTKINDFFSKKLKETSDKRDNARAKLDKVNQIAKLQKRPLSIEEKETEKIFLEAEQEYRSLKDQQKKAKDDAENRARELTFEFFAKNTNTILDLLEHDIPLHITIYALLVEDFSFEDEYRKFIKKNTPDFKDTPSDAEFTLFDDDVLRVHLQSNFKRFLNILKEKDMEGFKKACELINEGVKNKKTILDNVKKQLVTIFEDNTQDNSLDPNEIIKATTRKAKNFTSGTTKLETKVFNTKDNPKFYPANEAEIWVGNNKKNEIRTIASIDFNEMKKKGVLIPSEKWLNPFDREILSAASSLYEAGNEFITPKMIFQVLSGNKKNVEITPTIREEILRSIDKLMNTTIEINASAEVKAGWREEDEYSGHLLPCERISQKNIRLNGQEVVDCIHLFRNSPLYDYAKGINQISRTNIEMLNAPVNNTQENIMLKGYLLRQITSMKNPHSNIKPVIRYETIYEYLGLEDADTKTKKRIRDRTKEILSFWIGEGLITGFEEEKEGKTFAKIKITFVINKTLALFQKSE